MRSLSLLLSHNNSGSPFSGWEEHPRSCGHRRHDCHSGTTFLHPGRAPSFFIHRILITFFPVCERGTRGVAINCWSLLLIKSLNRSGRSQCISIPLCVSVDLPLPHLGPPTPTHTDSAVVTFTLIMNHKRDMAHNHRADKAPSKMYITPDSPRPLLGHPTAIGPIRETCKAVNLTLPSRCIMP